MILSNARILTFDDTNRVLDSGSVEILPDGSINAITEGPHPSSEAIDVHGRILMPALINCHTHLYSTLARGMALVGPAPHDFRQILEKLWWRLDRALNPEDIYYSALVGLIDSAKCGVATVIDHHSSPNACAGSLDLIERAFREVGLRGALCYEASDRNGPVPAQEGICENVRFLEKAARGDGMIGASFGLHASFTLSDATLQAAVEANASAGGGFHIHVAEGRADASAVTRLSRHGILNERTIAAHCVHVSAGEMNMLARCRVNVVHNPQSNCNNAVGTARVVELVRRGALVGLGSDGYSPRMWDEFKTALHLQKLRQRDPRVGYAEAHAAAFLNNRTIVRKVYGMDVGRIAPGARADMILLDYFPPTPISPRNLFGHLLFGISNAPLDSLIVNGRYVVRGGACVTVDEAAIARKAAEQARGLWKRFEEMT